MNKCPIAAAAAAALACCWLLTACGGGSDDSGAAASLAGLYEGSGGANRASELLILDSGRYYLVYGLNSSSAAPAGGVIVGDGSVSGNVLSSGNARDFSLQADTLLAGTLTSTVAPRVQASTALLRSDGSSATYAGTYNAGSGGAPSLSTLAGTYGGQLGALNVDDASVLTIDASGVIAGVAAGSSCTYGGLALPHGSGNVFDIRLNFGSGCPHAGSTLRGHAFLSGKVLVAVTVNGDLTAMVLFSGVKP
ncbi:MAG TPA: hypothetical protein VGP22_07665 [Albitalea sp.]|jgi:hypothetical protein|nr:hypothetical protein [Albitalea sp.]